MRILIYDTETTGLPEKGAGHHEYDKWPHIVQLSFLVYNLTDRQCVDKTPLSTLVPIIMSDSIVKPEGYIISNDVSQIHGITQEFAEKVGVPIKDCLSYFLSQIEEADVIVAHNSSFDKNTIHAEMFRCGLLATSPKWKTKSTVKEICTMTVSTAICRRSFPSEMEHPYPYDNRTKWPRLDELFRVLFPDEIPPPNLHNSLIDVQVTARCFFTMIDSGLISLTDKQRLCDENILATPVPSKKIKDGSRIK